MTWKWRGDGLVVYCQEQSHASRAAKLAWFTEHYPGPIPLMRLQVVTWLNDDDAPVDLGRCSPVEMAQARASYSLECPLCDVSLSIKPQRLHDALNLIAEAGVSEVSLRALVATLT